MKSKTEHKVEYFKGTFTDYEGFVRPFVMASVVGKGLDGLKFISIGISVCRPTDKYDEELGKRIALGKALTKSGHVAVFSGLSIPKSTASAILEITAKQFMENPGRFIAGYDADAARHAKSQQVKKYVESMSDDKKTALDVITNMEDSELDEFTEIANYIRLG